MLNSKNAADVPYRLLPRVHKQVAAALADKKLMFLLVEKYGSPLNIIFPEIFREKYQLFKELLEGEHLQHRLYYTCKPNRSDALLREAAALDAYVDVSSHGEFTAALAAGVDGAKISATGPKNQAYMDIILAHQALCVIDNWHEFAYIAKHAKPEQPVMVRLATPQGKHSVQDETFGLPTQDVAKILSELAKNTQLDFYGFACHYNGNSDDARRELIESTVQATLMSIEQGIMPRALNIGGGYNVSYLASKTEWHKFLSCLKQAVAAQGPAVTWGADGMGYRMNGDVLGGGAKFFNHYESITGELHLEKILYTPLDVADGATLLDFLRDSGLQLFIEPGRALLDQCGLTIAQVNFTKTSAGGENLVNLDIHHANLNAHAFQIMHEPVLIHRQENLPLNTEGVYYYSPLCMAKNLLTFHKTFPDHLPQADDIAIFPNTAGYRMDFIESEILRQPRPQKIVLTQQDKNWYDQREQHYKTGASA